MKLYGADVTRFFGVVDDGSNPSDYALYESGFSSKLDAFIDALNFADNSQDYDILGDSKSTLDDYMKACITLIEAGYTQVYSSDTALLGIESVDELEEKGYYTLMLYFEQGQYSTYEVYANKKVAELKEICNSTASEIGYLYRATDVKSIAEFASECFLECVVKHKEGLEGFV